ncbi:ABC transporter substrate-binding protein [Salinimonas sp. HHU 13199]|uniref:ABC transporter substrate-binding protein n=1 Tax=Salinimonas profundi TaxID=2729140 RepID=A0ABR8LIF6_9ALTE|nr:ABC transporter substrate-binding protein [Salinimonas profundi]MBD3585532.1 ABC transporter substrate-binding protein [Salinimonas profundi]
MAVRNYLFLICLLLSFYVVGSVQSATPSNAPLVIAVDADFSTVAAEGGEAIYRGARLAVENINEQGGLLGHPLKLVRSDHRGNPGRGIANINQLAETENLLAVIGGVHTPVAMAQLDAIHKHNLLYLGAWAAGTPVVDNGYAPNNVFRVSIRDSEAASVLLQHAKSRGLHRVALVLERTGWGRSNHDSLHEAAAKLDIDIVKVTWINWQQSTFAQDAGAIADTNAQAIILVANAPESAVVARAVKKQFPGPMPIIAHWGLAGGDFVSMLSLPVLATMDISVIQTFSFLHQSNPEAQSLFTQYKNRYDNAISPESVPAVVGLAHAYDLVHLLATAVKSAECKNTDVVRDALENLPAIQGAVKRYSPAFSSTRHDALWSDDYFMSRFDNMGNLIPYTR